MIRDDPISERPQLQSHRHLEEPVTGFIGLGSNLGDSVGRIRSAIAAVDRLPATRVDRRSSLYRSRPMGSVSQPMFINAVIRIRTRLSPWRLLRELHSIERRSGRVRKLRWGPRSLDLDILAHDDTVLDDSELLVPHPGIRERPFVLLPLAEIDPGFQIPGMGTPATLTRRCRGPRPERLVGGRRRGPSGHRTGSEP